MKLPKSWRDKKLDDPEVIQAYLNHCKRLINIFKPDYFSYGIEVNLLAINSPEEYERFIALAKVVYPELKKAYPTLPVMVSFYMLSPKRMDEAKKQVTPLLPYTDFYAVSTYPYMGLGGDGYIANEIPKDWFSQIKEIAPNKPFAIAETGYIAEDFSAIIKKMPGSAQQQVEYVNRLMNEATALNAEFVIWFIVADYDKLWTVLRFVTFFNPLGKAWKDTGLFDGDLKPRPALQSWDEWLRKPRRARGR